MPVAAVADPPPVSAAPVPPAGAAGPKRSLGHIRALDGLRGLLFLVVLSAHLEPWPNVVGGQVAMACFFALSGFLITALLVSERERKGTVSLRRFYARRALRLGPALLVFLLVWLLIVMAAGGHGWLTTVPGSTASDGGVSRGLAVQTVLVALGYATNWWTVGHLFVGYMPLGHLWSLAVEEQFYLLWAPLLALLLARLHRRALAPTVVVAAVSVVLPLLYWHGGAGISRIYDGTDTRAAALLLGCAGAMVWSRGGLDRLSQRAAGLAVGTAVGMLLLAGFGMHNPGSELAWVGGWTLASVGSALLLPALVVARRGLPHALLSTPVIVYVGQRSYGLYLWHYAFATWFNDLDVPGYALTVAASFVAAELSWRVVESPALALKARLEPGGVVGDLGDLGAVEAVGVVGVVGDLGAVGAGSDADLGSRAAPPILDRWDATEDGGSPGLASPSSVPPVPSLA